MFFMVRYRNPQGRPLLGFVHAKDEQSALKLAIKKYGLWIISVKSGNR